MSDDDSNDPLDSDAVRSVVNAYDEMCAAREKEEAAEVHFEVDPLWENAPFVPSGETLTVTEIRPSKRDWSRASPEEIDTEIERIGRMTDEQILAESGHGGDPDENAFAIREAVLAAITVGDPTPAEYEIDGPYMWDTQTGKGRWDATARRRKLVSHAATRSEAVRACHEDFRRIANDYGIASVPALDEIARLCGCPEWDYPAQIVRDVKALLQKYTDAKQELSRLGEIVEQYKDVQIMTMAERRMVQHYRVLVDKNRELERKVREHEEDPRLLKETRLREAAESLAKIRDDEHLAATKALEDAGIVTDDLAQGIAELQQRRDEFAQKFTEFDQRLKDDPTYLDAEASARFEELLENPPPPTEKLRKLMAEPSALERKVEGVAKLCPDGGTCYQACGSTDRCWRVLHGPPQSGVYTGNRWPAEVVSRVINLQTDPSKRETDPARSHMDGIPVEAVAALGTITNAAPSGVVTMPDGRRVLVQGGGGGGAFPGAEVRTIHREGYDGAIMIGGGGGGGTGRGGIDGLGQQFVDATEPWTFHPVTAPGTLPEDDPTWTKNPDYEPKTELDKFGYLVEECGETIATVGEVLAAVGKTLRWGLESTNPTLPPEQQETNRAWILRSLPAIARELPDLRKAIAIIKAALSTAPGTDKP